jgi:hypothetical protein
LLANQATAAKQITWHRHENISSGEASFPTEGDEDDGYMANSKPQRRART